MPSVVVFPMLESKVRPSTRNMQQSKFEAAGQFLEVGNNLFMDEVDQFRLLSPVSKGPTFESDEFRQG